MKIEGKIPLSGNLADRISAAKSAPVNGGKSFAAALQKAKDISQAPSAQEGMAIGEKLPTTEPGLEPQDYLSMVKFRMQSGFYDSKSINDALSEKLTGFFDDMA
jgi:hypothetical protein